MSGGIGTAVAEALAEACDGSGSAKDLVQAGLFDDLDPSESGALDAPSPLSKAHPLADLVGDRRRGRPKGARNRRTERTVQWFLAQNRHPLDVLGEAYGRSPAQLAEQLGLSKARVEVERGEGEAKVLVELDEYDNATLLELYKLQVRMAEAVLPYVAQRLPLGVQIDAKGALSIAIEGVSLPARGGSVEPGPDDGEVIEGLVLPFKSDGEVGQAD